MIGCSNNKICGKNQFISKNDSNGLTFKINIEASKPTDSINNILESII